MSRDNGSPQRRSLRWRILQTAGLLCAGLCATWALGGGCRSELEPARKEVALVRVAAAADLKFAFDELIDEFESANATIRVQVTYGSSGNFYAQLCQQAPFDIYFSADANYPRELIAQGHAVPESEFIYAIGQIVVWVPHASPIDVEALGMEAVLHRSVQKIAIANPQHAPYGKAAEAALSRFQLLDRVRERFVLGENVAQTAQFVESGGADVGIIALSLAEAPALKAQGRYWLVPPDAYPTIEQVSVILKWATDRAATEEFRSYVRSPAGRKILERYGFICPEE